MKPVVAIVVVAAGLFVAGEAMAGDEAKVLCEGGVCRLVDAPKVVCEGGVCRIEDMPGNSDKESAAADTTAMRLAQGYMPADKFIRFLKGEETSSLLPSSFFLLPFKRALPF